MKAVKAWAVVENGSGRLLWPLYGVREDARYGKAINGGIGLTIKRVEIREVKPKRRKK